MLTLEKKKNSVKILEIIDLYVTYGPVLALNGINIEVDEGSIVVILGSNGAGKSTLLNTISGVVKQKSGSIRYQGAELPREPRIIVKKGIVQVPEGRRIFGGLTVLENLIIGGYLTEDRSKLKMDIKNIFRLFPILEERQNQQAGTLSGGEQQMLAIGRGLMANPKLLMLDEPSLGLSPTMVAEVFTIILQIQKSGITVLLVEQNAKKALSICDYAYIIENGKIFMQGSGDELINNVRIKEAYLAG